MRIFSKSLSFSIRMDYDFQAALKEETMLARKIDSAIPFVPSASSATHAPLRMGAFSVDHLVIFRMSTL